jgi:uncharacterized protein
VAEIRDPVHGYIGITDVEREVIDSPFVQRLRRIHQLAGAYLVYPGAVHTRFEHVVGAMHVAGRAAEVITGGSRSGADEVQQVRLAALLHDVGHGPFSHVYEEVLAGVGRTTHEDISQRIVRETSVGEILGRQGFSAKKMAELAVGKLTRAPPYLNEIISGGLSADLMDYLVRDSYFTGVEYGKVDIHRVIDSLQVADGHLAIDRAALYAFEALLLARYEMFKAVYFHRTVRASELMIAHAMTLADGELHFTDLRDLDDYLELTDEIVLHKLLHLRGRSADLVAARRLAEEFVNRRLVKCVFERLIQRKDKMAKQILMQETARRRVVSSLSRMSGVGASHIYLDVPTTPSVPYTYPREEPQSITLVQKNGRRTEHTKVAIVDLPLVGPIAGYMDVMRVYTLAAHRERVRSAVDEFFGRAGPADLTF